MRYSPLASPRLWLIWRFVATLASVLARRFGIASVLVIGAISLIRADFHAAGPGEVGPPGSGIVLRNEVTVVWLPRALMDLARHSDEWPLMESQDELNAELERQGIAHSWYAFTRIGRQMNGELSEITQVRQTNELDGHVEEFLGVLSTAAERPPRGENLDFSRAEVRLIPERLLAEGPRNGLTELMADPDRLR